MAGGVSFILGGGHGPDVDRKVRQTIKCVPPVAPVGDDDSSGEDDMSDSEEEVVISEEEDDTDGSCSLGSVDSTSSWE